MRQLDIYVNDIKAGVLTEKHPGDGYCFQYEADYYLSDAPSISVTLSKRNRIYESALLFPFFANMLPEGANRNVICRTRRIDDNDLFGILYSGMPYSGVRFLFYPAQEPPCGKAFGVRNFDCVRCGIRICFDSVSPCVL